MNSQVLLFGICSLLCSGTLVNAQGNDPTILQNPCRGRGDGFARDLTSCNHYFYCTNGNSIRGVCSNNRLFDAEREFCVNPNSARCFQCPRTNSYELISVPNACPQFVRCFNGSPTLHICPQGLVFDGRAQIKQCNIGTANGSCYRENSEVVPPPPVQRCPTVTNRPVFFPDPSDCSVYYVCSGNSIPQRKECANRLHFNIRLGVCDRPENAQCQQNRPPAPAPPRPPLQPGPAIPCRPGHEREFVPHNQNCNLYYICTQTGPAILNCGNGLIFDYVSRKCTLRANGTCWGNTQ